MNAAMTCQYQASRSGFFRGFTLVELLVVLAIVAIILTFAYPSYLNQVIKARRADGHALLYEAAQRQQRHFTENNAFTATIGDGGLELNTSSQEGYYTLSVDRPSSTTYTLTAATVAPQTADTDCGNLTITHLNVKGCTASGCNVDRCW
jgi:type IV pilus assembly protein PilE